MHIWRRPQDPDPGWFLVLMGDKIGKGQVGAESQLQGQWGLFHLPI